MNGIEILLETQDKLFQATIKEEVKIVKVECVYF
jgi:hypothetical protein